MRLSICIPTYNRAPELRDLLGSIAAQSGHDLSFEIVISDNASTDGTAALVAEHIAAGMPILYDRLPENRGFDRNILNVTSIASGDYCWLFGSDDLMEPGALREVDGILRRYPDLTGMSIGSRGYNSDLSSQVFVTDNVSTRFSARTMLQGREQPIAEIGPWMGFMTSLIVQRAAWMRAVHAAPIEPFLTGYVHLYITARMLDDRSTWLGVPDRLVGCRTGNESFLGKDEFARTRLDMVGFDLVFGETLSRDNWAYHRAMGMVAGYFMRAHFLNATMQGASRAYWREALPTTLRRYWRYPGFWTKALPVAMTPRWAMLLARSAFRQVRKLRHR